MLPDVFVEKISKIVSASDLNSVLGSFNQNKLLTFRVNVLKVTASEVHTALEKQGFNLQNVPWYTDAFICTNKNSHDLRGHPLVQEGKIYIQNLSSMIPALVLTPSRGEKVLDSAAAPGSKTTQLSSLMANTGDIVANDVSRDRLYKLNAVLEQQGVTNVTTSLMDGMDLWKKYPEQFDKVLVDAPCSMEGMFDSRDPKTYGHWSQKKVKLLSSRQQYLLRSAVSATKPGGLIVYSTCTFSPEENEGVINWLLNREGTTVTLEDVEVPGLEMHSGLTHWNKDLDPSLIKTKRIYSSDVMEGFFVAKIRKLKSNL